MRKKIHQDSKYRCKCRQEYVGGYRADTWPTARILAFIGWGEYVKKCFTKGKTKEFVPEGPEGGTK